MQGWLRASSGDALLVTRDGAHSWNKVAPAAPKEVRPATEATYSLPTFEDDKHGFLPVTYSGGLGVKSAAVLFRTEDGGLTWKADGVLTNLSGEPVGVDVTSAVVAQAWLTADVTVDAHVTLSEVRGGATVKATSNNDPGYYGALQLSFVTPSRGWVLLKGGQLLSTADGGATWDQFILDRSGRETGTAQPRNAVNHELGYGITRMQLLGPGTGWAEAQIGGGGGLYETEDGGNSWRELRWPPGLGSNAMAFFFQDRKTGWIMYRSRVANLDPRNIMKGSNATYGYELSLTSDGGSSWTTAPVTVPDAAYQLYYLNRGQIEFVDSLHGWMNIDVGKFVSPEATNAAGDDISTVNRGWRLGGMLLITSDGGQTWAAAPNIPAPEGYFRLVTPLEGWWLTASGDALYVTRDGARKWERVTPSAPKEVFPAIEPTYDLPTFNDDQHGFLPVTFSGPEGTKSAAVLFATEDSGQSWKPDRILANLYRMPVGNFVPSTMAGSTWITADVSDYTHPTLTTLGPGARIKAIDSSWGYYGTFQLKFVTPAEGWLLLTDSDGTLLSTADGGSTWTAANPRRSTSRSFSQ